MGPSTRRLIEALHQAPYRYALVLTGGGTSAAAALLTVPGGSRTVLEVVVPYDERALTDYLGRRPEHFCAAGTAREMAERASERAAWLAPGAAVAGVAATASLATDRPKKGDHRFHLAVHTAEQVLSCSLTLAKGARDRAGEESVLDAVLLNTMAEAFGIDERVEVLFLGETPQMCRTPAPGHLAAFLRGEAATACVEIDGRVPAAPALPKVLVPGAFNPIHEGHRRLAAVASQLAGAPAAFELSVTNVDKPPLPPAEVRRRLSQFTWGAPVWLTRAPTFVEKALLFPGTVFAVGADTAERIVAPRYYQDSAERMNEALATIRRQRCRFLVAGRVDARGHFTELRDIQMPEAHRDLFAPISADLFRIDISSTELRRLSASG